MPKRKFRLPLGCHCAGGLVMLMLWSDSQTEVLTSFYTPGLRVHIVLHSCCQRPKVSSLLLILMPLLYTMSLSACHILMSTYAQEPDTIISLFLN